MRIGIDCRLWNQTGVGRYIRNLVTELIKLDNKNTYVLFVLSSELEEVKLRLAKIEKNNWQTVIADVHWHSIKEQIDFPKILNVQNLDLMHFTYFSIPIFYKKPFVITIHDLIPFHLSTGRASTLPYPMYLAKRMAYKTILKKAAKKSEKIIVPLYAIKTDVTNTLKVDPQKIYVTNEGFEIVTNQEIHSDKIAKLGKYFLYVGNAYPHKNIDALLHAFQLVQEKQNDVKLVLAGHRDYFYENILETKKNIEHVEFLFDTTDIELSALYKNAICLVSASKMEGFGLVPLEAMAYGCLPVLSDISSFKEVCADAALYFDNKNADDIAEKLFQAYAMGEMEKSEFQTKGKNRILQYSWNQTAQQTLEIYESCNRV